MCIIMLVGPFVIFVYIMAICTCPVRLVFWLAILEKCMENGQCVAICLHIIIVSYVLDNVYVCMHACSRGS